jgi:peptidoglycan/xylan/chitin deacetylase (PgdA/CDA1 family)
MRLNFALEKSALDDNSLCGFFQSEILKSQLQMDYALCHMFPLAIGAAALGGLGFAGYHSLAWRSQLYGRTYVGTPGEGRKLALTYDDGPNDPDTLLLLDVLAKHDVKATFFLIGGFVQQRRDIVRRIVTEGHEIGNHTFSHPNLALCSREKLLKEILWCEGAILIAKGDRTGKGELRASTTPREVPSISELERQAKQVRQLSGTRLFRPPFGLRRPATLRIARELGYTPVMWTVTCFDWKETTADRVERHAVRQIRGGDVILMHDGGHTQMGADRRHTVEGTDRLIRRYKGDGFEFVTVPEMMGKTGF